MKKIVFGILVLVMIGIGASALIGEDVRDRFNPLVKEKDVYVLIKGEGKPNPDFPHRYMFMLNGVDKAGNEEEIKLTASTKKFPENSYLKVHVKGKYVFEYETVQEKEVPEKAKGILEK
ncbi:YxeA family protein [Siminovitchia sp. 179-K 8D1 HS]|uniref:YxeA family protein n=1 Tax=Siminovitchia sp. 179-K 8D1 HS TaxID=3142385 RepID=UPI0039A27ED9